MGGSLGSVVINDAVKEVIDELTDKFRNGFEVWGNINRVKNGSVIIMHMTESAAYTAEALDIMIPEWKEQGYSFARVDEYLK